MTAALDELPLLNMRLLGGFQVERPGPADGIFDWQRRSAKTLTKLLATCPGHALHREQILDILWPGTDTESALNSFGKALHAARHAFEPGLPRRQGSTYLRLTDAVLALNTEQVAIDADRFEQLAGTALRRRDVQACEEALAAYGGELLPEDRYADWCADRRSFLADLHARLLLGLADVLESRGACNEAADRLRAVLSQDPTREVVHRRLMRLYAEMGTPDQAVRQFRLCQDLLQRELGLSPQPETVSLYRDILTNRVRPAGPAAGQREAIRVRDQAPRGAAGAGGAARAPFAGRELLLQRLCGQLARADRQAGMVVVSGETGVGKTRLLEELAARAGRQGAAVLWSGRGAHGGQFTCGLFAVALEGYAASLPEAQRSELAHRYPALARFVPSLRARGEPWPPAASPGDYHLDVVPAIVRLLTDLGSQQPVLLLLGDLHDADPVSLDLLRYLAHLAARRPWLLVGTVRDEEVAAGSGAGQMLSGIVRDGLCLRIELHCLPRRDCDELVRALSPRAVPDALLEQIYARSRGNPLFVTELVREISEGPGARPGTPSALAAPVPARVRALAATRLAAMDETLRRVLGLAAVGGPEVISLRELRTGGAALAPPVQDAALYDALDRALQMRILEERKSGGYAFRHPLFRAALHQCLSRHRRDQFLAALAAPLPLEQCQVAVSPAG